MHCISQIIEITETTSTDANTCIEIVLIESDKLQSILCAC